jgi:DNA-binding transcriptional LysR family regulator
VADLRSLEAFVWIAHFGGFRAAAERLHTTQPAVSQRIALLERELGVRLFNREPRGVALTVKGQELLPYAERILQLRAEMLAAARDTKAMRGLVRLGVAETIVHTWLATLIERLHAGHPELTLEIDVDTTPQLRERLTSHQLDIAFLLGPVVAPRVENVALSSYPMAWVADPRLDLGPEPVPFRMLANWPIITYPRSTLPYRNVRELFTRAGIPGMRIYGNSSLSTIVRMTLDRIGISVIPPVVIARELAEGRLRLVRAEQEIEELEFYAAYPSKPDSHMAEAIAAIARELSHDVRCPTGTVR